MITWLGQEQQDAATAAGNAAKKEAEDSPWPPTRDSTQAIGAAAGGAAGAVVCAETGPGAYLCAAAGSAIGAIVGGVVYDVSQTVFFGRDKTELRRSEYDIALSTVIAHDAVAKVSLECNVDAAGAIALLRSWDARLDGRGQPLYLKDWLGYINNSNYSAVHAGVEKWQRMLFASIAAAIAKCKTQEEIERASAKKSNAPLVIAGVVAAAGIAWLLFAA